MSHNAVVALLIIGRNGPINQAMESGFSNNKISDCDILMVVSLGMSLILLALVFLWIFRRNFKKSRSLVNAFGMTSLEISAVLVASSIVFWPLWKLLTFDFFANWH